MSSASNSIYSAAANAVELHKPVGADGQGEYSAATKGCFDVIATATPNIISCLSKISLPQDISKRAFVIADYGTADAGTSLGLVNQMVDSIRSRTNKNQEFLIIYEDQRENEWKSVFNHALGILPVADAYGVVQPTPYKPNNGVFITASGIGFHDQALPSNSVDFGVCFTAMHWLSKSPSSLIGKKEMHSARCNEPPAAEKEQAKQDFLSIMQARAAELRPGGQLVIANFCKSKEGFFLGQTGHGASMWDSFELAWAKLHTDGLIDDSELHSVSFPNYYRTSQEQIDIINAIPNLKLISAEERIVPCPFHETWVSGKSTKTAREHAEWFVPTTRAWSESTFKAALKDGRDKDAIMKKFWTNYVDIVEQAPDQHHMDYAHTHITVEKIE